MSFWYYRQSTAIDRMTASLHAARDAGGAARVLLDSGAFSADSQGHVITVKQYAAWLDDVAMGTWRPWMVGALNLDVLRDPAQSWKNWQRLRNAGHDTIPVVHMGDGFDILDRYVEAGADYVALGAMVGRSFTRKLRWAAHMHRHVRDHHPQVRLHALGVASQEMVERLPWWSVDSSSFSSAYRYGRAVLYDPRARKLHTVPLDGSPAVLSYGRLLRDTYGVTDPGALRRSHAGNRADLIRLAALSLKAWQTDLRRYRPVDPPPSRQGHGTAVHFVDGESGNLAPAVAAGTHVHLVDANAEHVGPSIVHGTHVHLVDTDPELATAVEDALT